MPADNEKQTGDSGQGPERSQQNQRTGGGQAASGAKRGQLGASSISTADPVVSAPPGIAGPPEEVVSFQTSQLPVSSPEYQLGSGGDVVREKDRPQHDKQQSNGDRPSKVNQRDEGHGGQHQTSGQDRDAQNKGGERAGEKGQNQERNPRNGKHRDRGRDEPRGGDREHRHKKKKRKQQPTAGQLDWKTVAITAVLALVCGVGGAWGYSALFGDSKSDKQDQDSGKNGSDKGDKGGGKSGGKSKSGGGKSKESGSSAGGASASEIPGFNSAKDADTFKKELEHLAHRLDLLGARIDQLTTNEDKTPPVLHTVQRKVTDLEREVDEVANLPSKLSRIEQKVSDLKQEFVMLKEQVKGSELPLASDLAPPEQKIDGNRSTAASADPANEATFKLATGLLREGHYSQSYEVLRRLQRERPDDARVWYLSALANGLSTSKWDGKTKRLAQQGVECERDGHPTHSQIDAALSGLGSPFGKDWIASQRIQAVKR